MHIDNRPKIVQTAENDEAALKVAVVIGIITLVFFVIKSLAG